MPVVVISVQRIVAHSIRSLWQPDDSKYVARHKECLARSHTCHVHPLMHRVGCQVQYASKGVSALAANAPCDAACVPSVAKDVSRITTNASRRASPHIRRQKCTRRWTSGLQLIHRSLAHEYCRRRCASASSRPSVNALQRSIKCLGS